MASTNKTLNLSLNSWIASDRVQMADFNADNNIIDALFAATTAGGGHDHSGAAGKGPKLDPTVALTKVPLLLDGSQTMTGQIKSSLATGTAPLSVVSTTLVSNLNADMLDGMHATTATTANTIAARDSNGSVSALNFLATSLLSSTGQIRATLSTDLNKFIYLQYNGTKDVGEVLSVHSGTVFKPLHLVANGLKYRPTVGGGETTVYDILHSGGGTIGGTTYYTVAYPIVSKLSGYKSMVLHHPTANSLILAPSATVDGEDWDWVNQFIFDDAGRLTANQGIFKGRNDSSNNNFQVWVKPGNGGTNTSTNQLAFGDSTADYVNVIGTRFSGAESIWVQNGYQPIWNADSWKQAAPYAQTRAVIIDNGYATKDLQPVHFYYALPGKAQSNYATFWDRKLRFALATEQDENWYISPTGSDANDGRSAATAKRTFQSVINNLPPVINHTITINIAAGSYASDFNIKGFVGNGYIYLNALGNYDTWALNIARNTIKVNMGGATCTLLKTDGPACLVDENPGAVTLSSINISAAAAAQHGINISYSPSVFVNACNVSNRHHAIIVTNQSRAGLAGCTGSNNNVGASAYNSTIMLAGSNTITGSTQYYQAQGGVIR
ncbi:hypothetical protein [Paenibacillus naphthalenovorans]|uniref:hypothetical protein n=1 Tax=Paenibacillus naphthalenovorans TaxID=162209 RepID=UPI000889FA04|nr:hypothetical protein [Paenibacillus naphthalenovorans]SDI48856.1 hypothetical protein SAMN05421868_10713 [Paenibacillus naphthalenovorans]